MKILARSLIGFVLLTGFVFADTENNLLLTQEQLDNLGISLSQIEPTQQFTVLNAPAKVVIPAGNEYSVSAPQAGLVVKLNASMGDPVKKGEVLAQINSPELLANQRLFLKAMNEVQLSILAFERDKKLVAEGVIADRRWQETNSQHNALVFEANELKQLLEISGMAATEIDQLAKTHQLSGQLNVRAPISGVILDRFVLVGERVNLQAPLYKVATLDELWLELNIPHERVGSVKLGNKVLIDNSSVSAEVMLIGRSVNPDNQTLQVKAKIRGKQLEVRAGQTINTQIIEQLKIPAYKVPNTAVAQYEGKVFVFVRTSSGFKITPITVIGKQGDDAIIAGDFSGTETLAVKGAVALKAQWLGLGSAE
ncbi:MAG: efflux RND transporter periplasmic adaptor subunit [Methylococcales bacterium]|nr:efflux RND transporter periplasmic adaptor subunit [Methylococcales bacterium]